MVFNAGISCRICRLLSNLAAFNASKRYFFLRSNMNYASLFLFLSAIFVCVPSAKSSQDEPESRISVPLEIDLANLANYANGRLPGTLHQNEYGRTCVEPERVCTKVPEFRGFKVTMKNRCVEVSPRIDCTITETVRREGPLHVSGNGGQIVLRQDIFGSGTVRGRGDIGRNIRQTVRARAQLTISARPGIKNNWDPDLPVDISYRWLQRPEFRLFNLFPITLGSTLGPPLDAAINDFKSTGVPAELQRIRLRAEADGLWQAIQAPHRLALPGDGALYLHLRPHAIGVTGPTFDNAKLRARLDMALKARVSSEPEGPLKTILPNLTTMPDSGISLNVPVRVDTKTLNAAVKTLLPETIRSGDGVALSVTVHAVEATIDKGRLSLEMNVDANGGPFSLQGEAVRVTARPALNGDTHELVLSDIELSSALDGWTGQVRTAALKAFELFLAKSYTIAFSREVTELEKALSGALNRDLTPQFRLVGEGQLYAKDLRLLPGASALEVTLSSTAAVRVVGFDPVR